MCARCPCGVCQIPYDTWPTLCCVADPAVCTMYRFREEVERKCDMGLFALFSEAFAALPLVTVIEDTAVVLHGGPTRHPTEPGRPQTLHEIDALDRFVQDVRMPSPASHASLNLSGMCAPHSPSQPLIGVWQNRVRGYSLVPSMACILCL